MTDFMTFSKNALAENQIWHTRTNSIRLQNGLTSCEELAKVNCAPGHPMANK